MLAAADPRHGLLENPQAEAMQQPYPEGVAVRWIGAVFADLADAVLAFAREIRRMAPLESR